jgi:hypothetical protein
MFVRAEMPPKAKRCKFNAWVFAKKLQESEKEEQKKHPRLQECARDQQKEGEYKQDEDGWCTEEVVVTKSYCSKHYPVYHSATRSKSKSFTAMSSDLLRGLGTKKPLVFLSTPEADEKIKRQSRAQVLIVPCISPAWNVPSCFICLYAGRWRGRVLCPQHSFALSF